MGKRYKRANRAHKRAVWESEKGANRAHKREVWESATREHIAFIKERC